MSTHEMNWAIVDRGGDGVVDIDAPNDEFGQVTVAMNIGPERARRIVACVNALRGVPTEILESFKRPGTVPTYSDIVQQRDKLLAALQRAERKLSAYVGVCSGDKELTDAIIPMVRAAISEVEDR